MKGTVFSAIIALLIVSFLTESAAAPESHRHAPTYRVNKTIWTEPLQTFWELLSTEPETARAELQSVAGTLFGGHPLAEEWVPLYFRISREGSEHLSDVKRVSELEIRMLTAINAAKYAKQIQRHREALERLDTLATVGDTGELLLEKHSPGERTEMRDAATASRIEKMNAHAAAFEGYLLTDMKSARTELAAFASLMFGEHPLKEGWIELFFRLSREKEATFPELIQLTEWHIQMLKDTAPEREAEQIAGLTSGLKQLKALSKMLKRQGKLTQKTPFNISLSGK